MTDFGLRDSFVASMKGVILGINPNVNLVDISHEVQPQNIQEAAFILKSSYQDFPKKTIHLVVIDPGVGSSRRGILMETKDYYFIAPDNGVLSWVAHGDPSLRVRELRNSDYFLKNKGPTFHGRDRFAPVAAWLSTGVESERFGDEIQNYFHIPIPESIHEDEKTIRAHVLYVDRFGNLITDITRVHLESRLADQSILITIGNIRIHGLKSFYSEGKPGQTNALINSSGHLEIYIYLGNANQSIGVSIGDSFTMIVGSVKS